jgi:hypothetical protein
MDTYQLEDLVQQFIATDDCTQICKGGTGSKKVNNYKSLKQRLIE